MTNPVNLNNPGNNVNPNSALPPGNGTNPVKVNNAAFEAAIVQAQGQGKAPTNGKIVQAQEAMQGAGVHGGHHHGANEGYLNGIANLGLTNPPGNNNNNTANTNADATAEIQAQNEKNILDTLA